MSVQKELEKLPPEERRKIGELIQAKTAQQEAKSGAPDASTSWMYEQPKRNAEDFLLGKAIRSLEELAEVNRDQEEETPAQRLTRLDMEAKFREDPLNLMKQHEMDKRSALLQNTARIKKLQRLIQMQNEARERAEKRKEKKRQRKHKKGDREAKRPRRVSESSSSSEDSGDEILEKFISLIRNVGGSAKTNQEADTLSTSKKEKTKHHHHEKHHKKHRSHSKEKSRSRSREKEVVPDRRRSRSRSGGERRSMYSRYPRPAPLPPPPPRSRTGKRSAEEMAALRAQMAADAREREAERTERFQRHRAQRAAEESEANAERTNHGATFLRGLTLAHVASTSVEEAISRKATSRQRGGMEENFLRR